MKFKVEFLSGTSHISDAPKPTWSSAALWDSANAERPKMGGSPPGRCLSWTVQDEGRGSRGSREAGRGNRWVLFGLDCHIPEFTFHLPEWFLQVLASQVKHPRFSLAPMPGETPPCAACAWRHTELFAELDLCLKPVFGRTVSLPVLILCGTAFQSDFQQWPKKRSWVEFQRDLYPRL